MDEGARGVLRCLDMDNLNPLVSIARQEHRLTEFIGGLAKGWGGGLTGIDIGLTQQGKAHQTFTDQKTPRFRLVQEAMLGQ